MDFESYILSSGYVDEEIKKVNQTITNVTNQVTSGIKTITQQNGNQLIFTLNDDSVVTLTVTGLSSNDYTTTEKNKLASFNNILSNFTYVDGDLLFNGNKVENNKLNLSDYYTQTQINVLLNNKANTTHTHGISDVTNLQTELNNRYIKTDTMSKIEIETLANSIAKGMNWKDSVETLLDLPLIGNTKTDTRIVIETSHMYVWNGTQWVDLGGSDNLPLATSELDGKMSKEDKIKLDSIILENLATVPQLNAHISDSDIHVTLIEKANYADKYTQLEVDNKISNVVTSLDWKEHVSTYNDIEITYPSPEVGWTVSVDDEPTSLYRYNGIQWVNIGISIIPMATINNDGLMTKEYVSKLEEGFNSKLNIWTVNTDYNENDFIVYNDYLYRCISNHNSLLIFDETKWNKISKDSFISQRVAINTIPNTIGQTIFNLPFTYQNINEIQIDFDGIPLNIGIDFIEDSNSPHSSIILTSAIDSLTENSVIYIRRIIGVDNILFIIDDSTPSDNSVYSSSKIENIISTCGTF